MMGKIAFLFPGQGAQQVGMGSFAAEHPVAKEIFDKADERLSFSLSDIIQYGPEDKLTRTENAQPAILSTSAALLNALKEYNLQPDYVAGHSLGEYSALVCAGALSFSDAVYTVRQRGLFMEEAVPAGVGAMAAILGMEQQELERITKEISNGGKLVQLANLNCPGQIVISGTKEGVEAASELAKEAGAKRVIPLQVSGPFHSELMKPAAEKLASVLDSIEIKDAGIPVVTNVTAKEITKSEDIKEKLIAQIYSPVRWEETIQYLLENGVDTFVEIGPGKVLSGLVKKVHRRANVISIQDLESLQQAVSLLQEV
jgi:[acyl-carrier-protein] S-malonyltransferase